ncbi:MAG TPA: hypothetical protein VHJ83_00655 [Micromonosporaceae bacterium]|nr:hypothetical protein [Micromonosporaceae bacterium]
MKVLTGLLTGSAAALAVGVIIAATAISGETGGSESGITVAAAPDRAGARHHGRLSQQVDDTDPKSHRLNRKTGSDNTPTPGTEPRETRISGYVTGYSYWDNTPPGSATISHPRIHEVADGSGTYADPVTVAVGHDMSSGSDVLDWPAGTRFYLPYLKRYFIVEDTCGDGSTPENGPCHAGYPSPAGTWLDVWVGGQNADQSASDKCMSAITGVHAVIKDPRNHYPVSPGEVTDNCATHGE